MKGWRRPTRPLKAALADLRTALPGVAFTVEPLRGGGARAIQWEGGPDAATVAVAAGLLPAKVELRRIPTQAECDAMIAQEERRRAAWLAEAPARRATGAAKAAETRDRRKALCAKLAAIYPLESFALTLDRGVFRLAWSDGPAVEDVALAAGVMAWQCSRTVSAEAARAGEEAARAKLRALRTSRRCNHAKARAAVVARGIARRALVAWKATRQLSFSFEASPA